PEMADIVDCDDQCMRLETIAEISLMARFGPAAAELDRSDWGAPLPAPGSFGFQAPIHFDDLLREHNRWYDRRIVASRLAKFSERRAAFDAFEADRRGALAKITGSSSTAAIERLILGSVEHAERLRILEDRAVEHFRLVRLGLMLVIYRGEHGA